MRVIIELLSPCEVDENFTGMESQEERTEHQIPSISEFRLLQKGRNMAAG